MHTRSMLPILIGVLLLQAGCATAPVQEMSDARQAVAVAERAGGMVTSAQLAEARSALTQAEQLLHRHEFRAAREQAITARQLAMQAQQATAQ